MRNYKYSGQSLSFTASEPLVSGQPYLLGGAFGVVSNSLKPGETGELFLTGVWTLPKGTQEIPLGSKLYWDPEHKILTGGAEIDKDPKGLKVVGVAAENADTTRTQIDCRFNGVAV